MWDGKQGDEWTGQVILLPVLPCQCAATYYFRICLCQLLLLHKVLHWNSTEMLSSLVQIMQMDSIKREMRHQMANTQSKLSSVEYRMGKMEYQMKAVESRVGSMENKMDRVLDLLLTQRQDGASS